MKEETQHGLCKKDAMHTKIQFYTASRLEESAFGTLFMLHVSRATKDNEFTIHNHNTHRRQIKNACLCSPLFSYAVKRLMIRTESYCVVEEKFRRQIEFCFLFHDFM